MMKKNSLDFKLFKWILLFNTNAFRMPIIIQGSSRSAGNTRKISDFVKEFTGGDFIALSDYVIGEFSYDGPREDDFEGIIEQIIESGEVILITPVYWYTMSARMKIFFDRITELLKWNKALGRKLRGTKMYVISASMHDDPPIHFSYPFEMSAEYLGMDYLGYCHTWVEDESPTKASVVRLQNMLQH